MFVRSLACIFAIWFVCTFSSLKHTHNNEKIMFFETILIAMQLRSSTKTNESNTQFTTANAYQFFESTHMTASSDFRKSRTLYDFFCSVSVFSHRFFPNFFFNFYLNSKICVFNEVSLLNRTTLEGILDFYSFCRFLKNYAAKNVRFNFIRWELLSHR